MQLAGVRGALDRALTGSALTLACTLLSTRRPFTIARSEAERQRIYRFRYQLYHEELGRIVDGLDHDRNVIEDALDDDASTLHVYQDAGGEVQMAMRLSVWPAGRLPPDVRRDFDLERLPWVEDVVCAEYGRLMARPQYRGGLRTLGLIASVTRMLIEEHGVDVLLASCKPGLVNRYVRLGLRPYTTRLLEYPDGLEIPLIAPIDREYARRIGSPLRRLAPANPAFRGRGAWDAWGRVEQEAAVVTDPRRLTAEVDALYAAPPSKPLIDRAVVDQLLRLGAYVLQIEQPAKLIQRGMKECNIYIVLDGEVAIEREDGHRATATRGDVVGEFALFLPLHRRTTSAYCTRARILVLKHSALAALKERFPHRYIALTETLMQHVIAKLEERAQAAAEAPISRPTGT